ncbi:hypothetical protein [Streptomyces sp. NPDC020965]|uniref:hypothetical protein n=1 Tax=Streptomyces sp. NPDC020965 TaxID=3365105 RepID=UPI0037AC5827
MTGRQWFRTAATRRSAPEGGGVGSAAPGPDVSAATRRRRARVRYLLAAFLTALATSLAALPVDAARTGVGALWRTVLDEPPGSPLQATADRAADVERCTPWRLPGAASAVEPRLVEAWPDGGPDDWSDPNPLYEPLRSLGSHPNTANLRFTLSTKSTTPVLVTAMTLEMTERRRSAGTAWIFPDTGCGGGEPQRVFEARLDPGRARVDPVPVPNAEGLRTPPFPYRVTPDDPDHFLLGVRAERCDCAWRVRFDWTHEGRTGTTRLDAGGDLRTYPLDPDQGFSWDGRAAKLRKEVDGGWVMPRPGPSVAP